MGLWEETLLSFSFGFFSILGVGVGEEEGEFIQQPRELLVPPTPQGLPRHDRALSRLGHMGAGDLWERKGEDGRGRSIIHPRALEKSCGGA